MTSNLNQFIERFTSEKSLIYSVSSVVLNITGGLHLQNCFNET